MLTRPITRRVAANEPRVALVWNLVVVRIERGSRLDVDAVGRFVLVAVRVRFLGAEVDKDMLPWSLTTDRIPRPQLESDS